MHLGREREKEKIPFIKVLPKLRKEEIRKRKGKKRKTTKIEVIEENESNMYKSVI